MKCITDIKEIFKILDQTCGAPVYKSVAKDENGCDVAVPVYMIGEKKREN